MNLAIDTLNYIKNTLKKLIDTTEIAKTFSNCKYKKGLIIRPFHYLFISGYLRSANHLLQL